MLGSKKILRFIFSAVAEVNEIKVLQYESAKAVNEAGW